MCLELGNLALNIGRRMNKLGGVTASNSAEWLCTISYMYSSLSSDWLCRINGPLLSMAINLTYMHNLRVEQCLKIVTSRHGSAFRITGPLWGVDSPQIAEGPVIQTFDVFFVVGLSKLVNKQSGFRWFVTPWRLCDVTVLCKCIFMNYQNNSAHYFLAIPTRSLCGPVSIEFQFQECLVGQLQNPSWCLDVNTMYLQIFAKLIILKH